MNKWSVDLFAIEVGARGYCAATVKSCLSRLDFLGKHVSKVLKRLSQESLKTSFEIWLSRDSFDWSNRHESSFTSSEKSPNNVSKTLNNGSGSNGPISNRSKTLAEKHPVYFKNVSSGITVVKNCGILNKGNTCYLNACLQCLSTMVSFWSNLTMFTTSLAPFVSSFVKIMSLLRTSKQPIDPSHFLKHLNNTIIKSGKQNFNIFEQQDAAEVLSSIFEELFTVGISAMNMVKVSSRVTITCCKCNSDNVQEDSTAILQVPVEANLQSSLNVFPAPELLSEENSYFCHVCQSHQSAEVCHKLSSIGKFLILQTKRFTQNGSALGKHLQKVVCSPLLSVPVNDNDRTEIKTFRLIGTINHTGSLQRGHFTTFIDLSRNNSWLHCNDAAVLPSNEDKINNNSSYLYFFELT